MTDILETFLEFDEILNKLSLKYDWFHLKTPKSSMNNTELFFIYLAIKKIRPEILFESGVLRGRSTLILSECMLNFGVVVSALFKYPEENIELFPFKNNNLTIVEGRGEHVITTLDKTKKLIAVIDGPKPNGYTIKRPGWIELMDGLLDTNLQAIFQHDISDPKHKEKFQNYFHSNMNEFELSYIKKSFLEKYKLYGMEDVNKEFIPNIGIISKKPQIMLL